MEIRFKRPHAMNSLGDMLENRILTFTPFLTPKGQMGKFLRRQLLDMETSCDVCEKRRCAICRSVDIAIYVCTCPKCRFDLSRSSEVKCQGQIE